MASVRLSSKSAICLSSTLLARFSSIFFYRLSVLDSCIPITPRLRVFCRVLQKVFNFVDIKSFWLSHHFSSCLNSVPKVTIAQTRRVAIAQSPRDTIAQSPKDTVAQSPRDTIAQSPRDTVAQSPRDTIAQSPRNRVSQSIRDTVAQSPRDTVAQSPRDTKSETPRIRHLFFLGNLLSCPPTRHFRPRLLLQYGSSTNELSESADQM